jgi:hypothetical protein
MEKSLRGEVIYNYKRGMISILIKIDLSLIKIILVKVARESNPSNL